ncbi:serine/threonine protein kinase [Penicillium verhagenii]|nr:serine/threonine protein kinase [Penicillium verhagenii]
MTTTDPRRPSWKDPSQIRVTTIHIIREITHSVPSSIFEVDMEGKRYALKLFHDHGEAGSQERGHDSHRFDRERNAYEKLHASGVCARNFVPKYYGYIDRLDPEAFHPAFDHFAQDMFKPRGILIEYFPNVETLNCMNYSDALYSQAIEGMRDIHRAGVQHNDIFPRNILVVSGDPDRLVWVDFDLATTFTNSGPEDLISCNSAMELVRLFGAALSNDQAEGLPPNTKYY